jgi:hypothetical protein
MGGLTQGLNINKNPDFLSRSYEKVSKTHTNNYDDECHKFNTNILTHGNNDRFMTVNTNNPLMVCNQNIRRLRGKTEEFLSSLLFDPAHIICLTGHHLVDLEMDSILIDNYVL